jgi:pimeloyl-ACP methyl ester carboxylesterase
MKQKLFVAFLAVSFVASMELLCLNQVRAQIPDINQTRYRNVAIEGLNIFYREAGSREKPTILLLQGFPTSSKMFRDLIIALQGKYHLVAPDYPGYGYSSMPSVADFDYTFDHLAEVMDKFAFAIGLNKYSIYLFDYGAPVGFRLATMHPEKVQSLIIQNGNAYDEGLSKFWDLMKIYWADPKNEEIRARVATAMLTMESMRWQYTNGMKDTAAIDPDNWVFDKFLMDRPGNADIQMQLLYSYGSNPPLYPKWHEYFRKYQPPTLIAWGENDEVFPSAGAYPYKKDLTNVDFHLIPTGHFALEDHGTEIATLIDQFLRKNNIK